uniref:AlNc14C317G10543 protein n=1 Tax=Albugo laibachii Nc14 TaxID=890382 RepID=F0WWA8_9STRA|nr:AlNc14C317G10543 [Albugo laibachii Nc14]|eukprot:CCA25728.1 AlNc14C317G10543 [Albugo laibachii Nc14]
MTHHCSPLSRLNSAHDIYLYTEKKSIFSWQDWSNLVPDLRLSFHFAFYKAKCLDSN